MPTQGSSTDRATKYLAHVLKLNPLFECDRLFSARAKFLRLDSADGQQTSGVVDRRDQRENLSRKIDSIRSRFWKEDIGRLQKMIDSLDCSQFPDLKNAAERLRTVAVSRHEFAQIAQSKHLDGAFFASLRKVLVAGPREADAERDEATDSIRDPQRLKKIKAMLRDLRKTMPQIYELENDWLEAVRRMRKRRKQKGSSVLGGGSWDFEFENMGWVIAVIIVVVLRLLRMMALTND